MKKLFTLFLILWTSMVTPIAAFAQEAVDATGQPTGAPSCTGAGCGQGANQGANQGVDQGANQGGLSAEELGAVQNENGDWVFPEGIEDTRQGAAQGSSNGTTASNGNTGSDSTNTIDSDVNSSDSTNISNTANDTTTATATGNTGGNGSNRNTGNGATNTGNAGIGVTSVKNDNTAVIGGSAGLDVTGHNGDYTGDYAIGFGSSAANLGGGGSYQATNDTTGSGSTNAIDLNTHVEEINEVQNDGQIVNDLVLKAITGLNEASMNTGNGDITTGDANIAATLVNLLNSTVINGSLMVSVADIFGDLVGNITLPDLAALAAAFLPASAPAIVAGNENTGSDSINAIDVELTDTETTTINNDANITTTVNADAITGQNNALMNTGGGLVDTGDASVSASNISLANTTVEGGNWGLVIVNALNRWLGFLVGDNGQVRALSQAETIEAINRNTGADSNNTIDITNERERTTTVENDATITNEIDAHAITGQNMANKNTGAGRITTGDANITATAVNIANTTVKDASLFIAVVNIFGDWFGDLLYSGSSLAAAAGSQQVQVEASNQNTGSESENTINVNVDHSQETTVDNNAAITTNLNANIDTGTNKTNKNTLGGNIETGNGVLALHSRALANLTGIALDPALGLTISGLNDTTGFDSRNRISAEINDARVVSINNFADVDTIFASFVNTGNNEANQNTIGGSITTGNIDAEVGIDNIVNRVILALADGLGFAAGDQVVIDADFINRLTGALSENTNEASVNYDFLADINNQALIDNLLRLLFNTGGNKANENTLGAATNTGRICFEGNVRNNANQNTLGLSSLWSVNADNDADVHNDANIQATTGNNEMNNNTSGSEGEATGPCEEEKLAVAPSPSPAVPPVTGAVGGSDQGGDDQPSPEASAGEGRIAAAVQHVPAAVGQVLKRFPVAGASPWPAFAAGSIGLLAMAYHFDRRRSLGA